MNSGLTVLGLIVISSFAAAQKLPVDSIKREILAAHNIARSRAGVPPMTWSDSLAAFAQQWANSLVRSGKFVHRPESGHGENLFEIRGGKAVPLQVVQSWVDEEKDYQSSTNTCRAGAGCGHYTQVVWKASLYVGCARPFICRLRSSRKFCTGSLGL